MRLLFAVQRYGVEVPGGAEAFCRMMAAGMAGRGHHVEVVTSRALSYSDWADAFPPGVSHIDGVAVHRLPLRRPRLPRFFAPLDARAMWGHQPCAQSVQEAWLRAQGPDLVGLGRWVQSRAAGVDAVIAFTYLYATTWDTLHGVGGAAPIVLHSTAHDEAPLWMALFDRLFHLPQAFAWSSPEERDLMVRRVGHGLPGAMIGIGTDLTRRGHPGRFARRFGLGDSPYLLYTGRIDPAKGTDDLYEQFVAYRARRGSRGLKLVLMGDPVLNLAPHPDVVVTGFVDDHTRADAVAGCRAMVVPSYFESFSMALTEAWAQGRPALVQGRCAVLAGQARRSGGALCYTSFAELEAALEVLEDRPDALEGLGENGRRYVEANYAWDAVLERYEALLHAAARRHRARRRQERTRLDARVSSGHA